MSSTVRIGALVAGIVGGVLIARHASPHVLGWLWLIGGALIAWQGLGKLRGSA